MAHCYGLFITSNLIIMEKMYFTVTVPHGALCELSQTKLLKAVHVSNTVSVDVEDGASPEDVATELESAYCELYGPGCAVTPIALLANSDTISLSYSQKIWYRNLPDGVFKTGAAISSALLGNISQRTAEKLLANEMLFERVEYGQYRKMA